MLYEIDVNYGEKCEKIMIIKLQDHFNNKLIKLDYYDNFDFIDAFLVTNYYNCLEYYFH